MFCVAIARNLRSQRTLGSRKEGAGGNVPTLLRPIHPDAFLHKSYRREVRGATRDCSVFEGSRLICFQPAHLSVACSPGPWSRPLPSLSRNIFNFRAGRTSETRTFSARDKCKKFASASLAIDSCRPPAAACPRACCPAWPG